MLGRRPWCGQKSLRTTEEHIPILTGRISNIWIRRCAQHALHVTYALVLVLSEAQRERSGSLVTLWEGIPIKQSIHLALSTCLVLICVSNTTASVVHSAEQTSQNCCSEPEEFPLSFRNQHSGKGRSLILPQQKEFRISSFTVY